MHGVFLIPKKPCLKISLDEHVRQYRNKMYQTQKYRIDVAPMDARVVYTTGYAGKALKTPRFDQDDILILPKTTGELESAWRVAMFGARKIRDIQSRHNVSDEVARNIASNRRLLENIA